VLSRIDLMATHQVNPVEALAGTFLVLVVRPDIAFQAGNPFLLTTEGEFVVKNLVLIAGGLVVGSTVRKRG
jgi:uncharacterized membrane protein YkgB